MGFIDDFPVKTSVFNGFSMAMLNNQRVINIYPGHITLTADSLSCSIKGRHFRRCQEHGFQPDLAGGEL